MIGARIRRRREALGLTQAQVAAGLFDRSYISLIERGRVVPPMTTLQLLADRLKVPVVHLLDGADPAVERAALHLLRMAQRANESARPDEALEHSLRALDVLPHWSAEGLNVRVHLEAARALAGLSRMEEAAAHLKAAFGAFTSLPEDERSGELTYTLHYVRGKVAFERGEYQEAAEAFDLALPAATSARAYVKACVASGSANYRRGCLELALQAYRRGLDRAAEADRLLQAMGHHGCGTCLADLGKLDAAMYHTRTALRLYRGTHPRGEFQALQNLGIILGKLGKTGPAMTSLRRCLKVYRHWKDNDALASVLLDLARLYLSLNRPKRAGAFAAIARSRAARAQNVRHYIDAWQLEIESGRFHEGSIKLYLQGVINDLSVLIRKAAPKP